MFRNLSVQRTDEEGPPQPWNARRPIINDDEDDEEWMANNDEREFEQEYPNNDSTRYSRSRTSRQAPPSHRGGRRGNDRPAVRNGAIVARNTKQMSLVGVVVRAVLWLFVVSSIVAFVGRRVSLSSSASESYYETAFFACRVTAIRGAQWSWQIFSHLVLGLSRFIIPSSILDLTNLSESIALLLSPEHPNGAYVPASGYTSPIIPSGVAQYDEVYVAQQQTAPAPMNPIHHDVSEMPVVPGEYDFFVRRVERLPKTSPNELLGGGDLHAPQAAASTCIVSSMVHESVSRGGAQTFANRALFEETAGIKSSPPVGFNALADVWTIHVHEYGEDDGWPIHRNKHHDIVTEWLRDESATSHRYMLMVTHMCGTCQWINHATGARGNLVPCNNCNLAHDEQRHDVSSHASSVVVGIAHVYAGAPMSMKQIVAAAYDEDEVWEQWRNRLHVDYHVIGANVGIVHNANTHPQQSVPKQRAVASLVWHSFFTTARNDTQYTKRQWHYLQTAFPLSSPTVAQSIPAVDSLSLLASLFSASVPPYDVPLGISSDLDTIQMFKAIVVSRDRMILGRVRRELVDTSSSSSSNFVSSLWRRMRDQKLNSRSGTGIGPGGSGSGGLDIYESVDVLASHPLPERFFDLGVTAVKESVTEEAWDSPIVPGTDFGEWYEYFLLMTREKMWRAWHRQALHKPLISTASARREDNTTVVSCDYESILNDLVLPSILDMSTVDDAERVDIRRLIRSSLASSAAAFSSKGTVPIAVFESSLDTTDVNEVGRDLHSRNAEPLSASEVSFLASSSSLDRDEAMKSLSEICSYDTSSDRLSDFHRASAFVSSLMPDIYPFTEAAPPSYPPHQQRVDGAATGQPRAAIQANQQRDASTTYAPSYTAAPTMGRCIALASAMAWYDVVHSDVFLNRHSIAGAVAPQHTAMRVERVVRSETLSPSSPIYASSSHAAQHGLLSTDTKIGQPHSRRSFQRSISSAACNASPEQNWHQWRVVRNSYSDPTPRIQSEETIRRDYLSLFVDEWNDNALSSQPLTIDSRLSPNGASPTTHATSRTATVGHHFAPLSSATATTCDNTWASLKHALRSNAVANSNARRVFVTSSPICTIQPSTFQILQYASHILSSCYN